MIYLLEDVKKENGKTVKVLKIGFTDNWKLRERSYNTMNISYRLLKLAPGDRKLEKSLHRRFKDLRVSGEWFKYDKEILSYFNELEIGTDPKPKKEGDLIHWSGFREVSVWLGGRFGIDEKYIKVFFDFPDKTIFNADPYIDSALYESYLRLLEVVFRYGDKREVKSLNYAKAIHYKIQSIMQNKGIGLKEAVNEMAKTLLRSPEILIHE